MRNKFLLLVMTVAFAGSTVFAQKSDTTGVSALNLPVADYNQPKMYILNNVTYSGVNNRDMDMLIASVGLSKGDTMYIPGVYISQTINKLWSQRYFSDVKIVAQPVGDSVNLEIVLKERPLIYKWEFKGARKSEITDMTEKLKLRAGTELSDYVIARNKGIVKKFYDEKGFLNAEVDITFKNDPIIQNGVNLVFDIKKHGKVRIGEVEFEGNKIYSDKKLSSTLKKTHKKNWMFWKNSKFKEKEYEEDKYSMIDFYNSKGYRNAMIVSDSVYNLDKKDRIGIKFNIDEGNKYYFRNISWVGNSKYQTSNLETMLGIKTGDTYDRKTLQKRLGVGGESNPDDLSVSSLYQNEGYLFSQIDPAEIIIGEDSIDLEIKIFEGRQARINEVRISGNNRINDEVIRRELYTRPGELYNRALLMSTIRQLSQMQHFDPEAMQPEINPVSGELVNIGFPLQEIASDRFEVSGGWGAGMFVGSVGVELNNVSLKEFFKKGAWRPYPHGQNQQLKIRGQSNGSYYKALSLSFTDPWVGGKKPNSLTVSTHYSSENTASYFYQTSDKYFRTVGLAVGVGRRLKWPDNYFTLYNEVGYQSYILRDWDYFIMQNGSANIFSLKTVFGRNSVDQPIYPRTGSDISLAVTLTPPYSLFESKDYSSTTMSEQDRYKFIEYHKWQFKAQWFYPLSADQKFVLMAKAEMGYIGSYDKNKPSPFEGFEVGGDGMSGYNMYGVDIIGMRGYENGSLTATGNNSRTSSAYNKYTIEVRYPFILKPSSQIYGLVFAEGGNAFSSWATIDPFLIKRSLGIGVRLYLPVVGMIGVDWGYGFDKVQGSDKKSGGHPHFTMGMQF